MVHGKKRIPYRIDRRLPGLAGSDYGAAISFGLPYEPEDPQYGEYRLRSQENCDVWHGETPRNVRITRTLSPHLGKLSQGPYGVSFPSVESASL